MKKKILDQLGLSVFKKKFYHNFVFVLITEICNFEINSVFEDFGSKTEGFQVKNC